ncbi:MAG: DUF1092 family protein [Cyanobacteria bacterium WB6_1B_304]|jgi:hypothetical protein|nr:DUF1092 family protein [Cyanobacteria bacterium WB6_1B_304]
MITIWEIDYYSRPVLDENQKKVWELVICESELDSTPLHGFRYTEFCPGTQVNSIWLQSALANAIQQAPHPPDRIRFFRRQMFNMISKACSDLGIPAAISRRTHTLSRWLNERHSDFYPNQPGYQPSQNPSVQFEVPIAQPLPDALIGERWAFVNLEVGDFVEMGDWSIDFGERFSLTPLGMNPQTKIPGLIVFSRRALPIAAWLSGLELAYLEVETISNSGDQGVASTRLVLETGMSDRWIMASFNDSPTQLEAKRFESAKASANQVHFLALQTHPEAQSFTGFWMLQKLNVL